MPVVSRIVAAPPVKSVAELLAIDPDSWVPPAFEERMGKPANASDTVYKEIMKRIEANAFTRAGIDPQSCKSIVRDGLTGDTLPNPITVGCIGVEAPSGGLYRAQLQTFCSGANEAGNMVIRVRALTWTNACTPYELLIEVT